MTRLWQNTLVTVLGLILFARTLVAHDYWLEADKNRLETGEKAILRLKFGENFAAGIEKPLQKERTAAFRLYGQNRKYDNLLNASSDKALPVAVIPFVKQGPVLITMDRTASDIQFGRVKFLEYTTKEGYAISESELPAAKTRIRETYTRHLKTLLQIGTAPGKIVSKSTGQTYEIIPLADPYQKGTVALPLRVLYQGQRAAGMKVTAIQCLHGRLAGVSAITNSRGQCTLPLTQSGRWLIRSVKIIPDAPVAGNIASYHSHWSMLTFGYE